MAFDINYLVPTTDQAKKGVASTRWSYWTLDAAATVDTAAYFNGAAKLLQVGDIIDRVTWATAIGTGGTISTYGSHIVNSNAAGVVDVSDANAATVTDTD
jgi:hypothetical protein